MDETCAARMCPKCSVDSAVYDSREGSDGSIIRRRRCPACGTRFETAEKFVKVLRNRKAERKPGRG